MSNQDQQTHQLRQQQSAQQQQQGQVQGQGQGQGQVQGHGLGQGHIQQHNTPGFSVPISNLSAGLKSVHISENSSQNNTQQSQQQEQEQQQQSTTGQSIYSLNNNDNGILGHESIQNRYEYELNSTMNSESVQRLKSFFQGSNSLSSSVGNHMSISHNSRHNSRSQPSSQIQAKQQQAQQQAQQQQEQEQEQMGINVEGYTLISHRSAPNGFKIAIILSELDLPYQTIFLDFNKNEQRTPEFLTINPNGRVPALIDHTNLEQQVSIWESGAIILYLVQKKLKEFGTCSIWSDNLIEQSQILSWLFFQTSGHSPMIGQALHFRYFHPDNVPSAIERYTSEVRRVYSVIEMALAERREALIMELDAENASSYSQGLTPLSQSRYFDYPVWLVGERITIADLCFVTWNYVVDRIGIDMKNEFPEVYKWTKHMMRRPAVMRALNV